MEPPKICQFSQVTFINYCNFLRDSYLR